MNNQRRKAIQKVFEDLVLLVPQIQPLMEKIAAHRDTLQQIADQEQEYLEGKSEKWRESEKGAACEEALQYLNTAIQGIDELADIQLEPRELFDALDGAVYDPEG